MSEDDLTALTSAFLSDIGMSPDTLDEKQRAAASANTIRAAFANQIYQQETGQSRDPVANLMAALQARKLSVPAG